MKRLNQAFAARDEEAIVNLVRQWEAARPVAEDDPRRVTALVTAVDRARARLEEVRGSELAAMMERAMAAAATGTDLLAEWRASAEVALAAARVKLAALAVSDFLDDGRAALEWVERYLERVGELPVLAQVEPGEIRARLPASAPEEAEPFSAVLRDLDEVLLPGVTHWQHPRYFAYFATNASRPGDPGRAARGRAQHVAILWRTAPASTELEGLVCDWVAQLLGLPEGWHGHIEDAASTSTLAALIAARHATGRDVVVVLRARALVGREGRADARDASCARCPVDDEFRMRRRRARPRPTPPSWCRPSARPRRPRSTRWRRSPTCASRPARGCTSTPPTRAPRWSARSTAGRSRASSAPTRSSSTRTSGCSRRWTARCCGRAGPRTSAPRSASSPSTCARPTRRTR